MIPAVAAALASPPRAAIAAVLLAAVGAALLWGSARALADARHALEQVRSELRRSEAALEAARRLDAALAPARQRWAAIEDRGAVSPPEPARWRQAVVETLRRHELDAAAADLHFAPPQEFPSAGQGEPALVLSRLHLQLPLRHEGRLPPLLAALEALPGALVAVHGCTLERLPRAAAGHDRLSARCTLDWLTLTLPAAGATR